MNLNLNGMVSMWKMRELVDKATNIVMNYTETEAKVIKNFEEEKVFQACRYWVCFKRKFFLTLKLLNEPS